MQLFFSSLLLGLSITQFAMADSFSDLCARTSERDACETLVVSLMTNGDYRPQAGTCDFYPNAIVNCNPDEEYEIKKEVIYTSSAGAQIILCDMKCREKVPRDIPAVCESQRFTNVLNYYDANKERYSRIEDTIEDIIQNEICGPNMQMRYQDINGECSKECTEIADGGGTSDRVDRTNRNEGDDDDDEDLAQGLCETPVPSASELDTYFSSLADNPNNTEDYQRQVRACAELSSANFSLYRDPDACEILKCNPPDEQFPYCQNIIIPIAPCNDETENTVIQLVENSNGTCEMVCLPKTPRIRRQLPAMCNWVDSSENGITYSRITEPATANNCEDGETCIGVVTCPSTNNPHKCKDNPSKVFKDIYYIIDPCEIHPEAQTCMSCADITNSDQCNAHETPYDRNACQWDENSTPSTGVDDGYYTVECKKDPANPNSPCPVNAENCVIIKEGL